MKIYTGSGDKGKTSLFSGERLPKSHLRVEAYGDVDELTSILGGVIALLTDALGPLGDEIRSIQSDLMQVGAWLSTTSASAAADMVQRIGEENIQILETAIDRMQADLPGLRSFILPGGHPSAVWSHLARTVCRRAERHAVRLQEAITEGAPDDLKKEIVYLNRLSDYLFVLARHCNHMNGVKETPWTK